MNVRAKKAVARVVFIAMAVTLIWSAGAHAAFPGANGKIALETGNGDIWVINPDGSGRVNLTATGAQHEHTPHWSPDGQRLLFQRDNQGWTMNADGTIQTPLPLLRAEEANWSPDGQQVVFTRFASPTSATCEGLYTANLDGTGETEVLAPDTEPCFKGNPAWQPSGNLIAFDGDIPPISGFPRSGIFTVRLDGTDLSKPLDEGLDPDWSPAGHRILYTASILYPDRFFRHDEPYTMQPDGSAKVRLSPAGHSEATLSAWSPDGTEIVFTTGQEPGGIWKVDDGGGNPVELFDNSGYKADWQPLPPLPPEDPGYPRPRGASPFSVPLVPAHRTCTDPNRTHGEPLAFGSCSPPQQVSDSLTVGTPDANGQAANSVGQVTFRVVPGNPATGADEADVRVSARLTDVRCRVDLPSYCEEGALSDYLGDLEIAPVAIRITDRGSGGAARDPATGFDVFSFKVPMPCVSTSSATAGSSCEVETTVDALAPGTITENKRSVWELDQMTVRDAGIDDPQVEAYATLAVQGVFVP